MILMSTTIIAGCGGKNEKGGNTTSDTTNVQPKQSTTGTLTNMFYVPRSFYDEQGVRSQPIYQVVISAKKHAADGSEAKSIDCGRDSSDR